MVPSELTEIRDTAIAAKEAATQTNNTMNTIISPKLTLVEGAVRDSSGSNALSMAQAAKNSADIASQNASNAKTSAETAAANELMAANRTQQVIDQTWESSENKSAATLSKEARDRASEAVETI